MCIRDRWICAAWWLPAQIHNAKSHRVELGPHEMNRVHAQSHPATQHQTEKDQTAMNQAGSQDRMTNPAVSQDQVISQEETHRRPAQGGLTPPGEAELSPSGVPP